MLKNPPGDKSGEGPFGPLPPDLTKELGSAIGLVYMQVVLLGVALLAVAGIGKIIWIVRKRRASKMPNKSSLKKTT
jgi:hypothetical protein